MNNIPHSVCAVIPSHILNHIARHGGREAAGDAHSTLEQMREIGRRGQMHFAELDEPQVDAAIELTLDVCRKTSSTWFCPIGCS
ncbi:MAG TPA: hypothetical protein VI670_07950 [Thermoanaerobaculia bacterium]|jgi:hypothetical protein